MNKISQSLDLRQTQNLVMTPQLQQAIKLLQLNNMELSELVEEELAQNPLLEKAPEDSGENSNAETDATNDSPAEKEKAKDENSDNEWDQAAQEASDAPDDFDAGSSSADIGSGGSSKFENPEYSLENTLSDDKTLREHLTEQLFVRFDDPRDRLIGAMLIDQLDVSGYLRADTKELAEQLGCSLERMERLVHDMKQFDPTGVFARDLPECLALQLDEAKQLDAPMQTLLDHLDLLARHDHAKLAEVCGVNDTYLADMIAEIRALNPKPASEFDHMVVQTVVPDVLMKRLPKDVGGGWRVELNNDTLPRVLVNNEYYTEVAQHAKDKKDKKYLDEKLQSANWLVRAMDQRAKTILKVAGEMIEQQNGFFLYGVEFLKPLTLKDIATEIEMHESTVSRVTTNKYIGTPRGIFELKYFFSSGVSGASGTEHAAEAVKSRIKNLIDAEDPKKILSDDKIVELLGESGIEIARRTIAKYREAMHIGSSVQRRREKKNTPPAK
jgi:RNA polymerase sigma-54 factor